MPFGSRGKGKKGEREVAKLIEPWWQKLEAGCRFVSTPQSGGWQAPEVRSSMKMCGDLCTTAKRFPFCIEVKRRERFGWKAVFEGRRSPVWTWWKQCCDAAKLQGDVPLLLFRKNKEPWWAIQDWIQADPYMRDWVDAHRIWAPHSTFDVVVYPFEYLLKLEASEIALPSA